MADLKKVGAGRKVEFSPKDGRPVYYANGVGVRITPWDFAFQLGTISAADEKGIKIQENLCVYMSPQHTKAFLALLINQIKLYEEKFGVIPEVKVTVNSGDKKPRTKR